MIPSIPGLSIVLRFVLAALTDARQQDRERTQDQKDSRQHQRTRRTRLSGKLAARARPRRRGARQRSSGPRAQLCGSQIGQVTQR